MSTQNTNEWSESTILASSCLPLLSSNLEWSREQGVGLAMLELRGKERIKLWRKKSEDDCLVLEKNESPH